MDNERKLSSIYDHFSIQVTSNEAYNVSEEHATVFRSHRACSLVDKLEKLCLTRRRSCALYIALSTSSALDRVKKRRVGRLVWLII